VNSNRLALVQARAARLQWTSTTAAAAAASDDNRDRGGGVGDRPWSTSFSSALPRDACSTFCDDDDNDDDPPPFVQADDGTSEATMATADSCDVAFVLTETATWSAASTTDDDATDAARNDDQEPTNDDDHQSSDAAAASAWNHSNDDDDDDVRKRTQNKFCTVKFAVFLLLYATAGGIYDTIRYENRHVR